MLLTKIDVFSMQNSNNNQKTKNRREKDWFICNKIRSVCVYITYDNRHHDTSVQCSKRIQFNLFHSIIKANKCQSNVCLARNIFGALTFWVIIHWHNTKIDVLLGKTWQLSVHTLSLLMEIPNENGAPFDSFIFFFFFFWWKLFNLVIRHHSSNGFIKLGSLVMQPLLIFEWPQEKWWREKKATNA